MYFADPTLSNLIDVTDIVVFDMNGLIVDDEPIQRQASNLALRQSGLSVEISEQQWIDQVVGRKPAEWFPEILDKENVSAEKLATLIAHKDQFYATLIGEQAKNIVRPGFLAFLSFLTMQPDKKIALATSTTQPGMELILGPRNLNIAHLFSFMICGDQVRKAKPDPEIYLAAKNNFPGAKNFLVFEDTSLGILSAHNAGMPCIAVPNRCTNRQDFTKASAIIASFEANTETLTPQI